MNFNVNREDFEPMMRVIKAAEAKGWYDIADRMTSVMDLSACHANGCPLDFARMEAAIASETLASVVAHDLGGIRRHIDRETGKLGDCFLPRYAKRERTTPVSPYQEQDRHALEQQQLHEDRHSL